MLLVWPLYCQRSGTPLPSHLQDEMQRFTSVLLLARLLAKFLGFLSFLPYQTSETPSGEIKEAAISLRNKVCLERNNT